ncbi:SAF domain-containing protein [Archangium lansingense]|uniref:SAF domain-containing protein n=1 Tax=Archangium lansingense TaxID=2995310 RepID=UPI003B7B43A2
MRPHHLLMLAPLLVVMMGARPGKEPRAPAPEQVSITVAVRDIAAGERVTEADFTDLLVPKEWVTTSLVKPDSREYIIGQRVLLPVMKGDLISWSLFETTRDSTIRESCASASGQPATAAEQVSRARQVLLERQRQGTPAEH